MDEYHEAVERRKQESQDCQVSPTEPFSLTTPPTQYYKGVELASYLESKAIPAAAASAQLDVANAKTYQ